MQKREFFNLISEQGIAEPQTVNGLKRTVERIVRRLARGDSVNLPGVGKLVPQSRRFILFKAGGKQRSSRGGRS